MLSVHQKVCPRNFKFINRLVSLTHYRNIAFIGYVTLGMTVVLGEESIDPVTVRCFGHTQFVERYILLTDSNLYLIAIEYSDLYTVTAPACRRRIGLVEYIVRHLTEQIHIIFIPFDTTLCRKVVFTFPVSYLFYLIIFFGIHQSIVIPLTFFRHTVYCRFFVGVFGKCKVNLICRIYHRTAV